MLLGNDALQHMMCKYYYRYCIISCDTNDKCDRLIFSARLNDNVYTFCIWKGSVILSNNT